LDFLVFMQTQLTKGTPLILRAARSMDRTSDDAKAGMPRGGGAAARRPLKMESEQFATNRSCN
jgi:hypothetical protein